MKRQLTLLTMLIINLTVFGQHNLGLKVNGGPSKISYHGFSTFTTLKNQFALSGQGGLFYNLQLGNKAQFGAELLFIQIQGKGRTESDVTDPDGNPTGELQIANTWTHISYIGIPIYYGLKIKKLTLNLGFQVSFTLASGGREKVQVTDNGSIRTINRKFDKMNIDNYDFGPRAGVIFNLSDKFAIEGLYYYGINNILLGNNVPDITCRVQQATVGLRYTFMRTFKKK